MHKVFSSRVGVGFQVPSGLGATMPAATTGGPMAATEEDGMPKEDPSKLERAPGEEDEEVRTVFTHVISPRQSFGQLSMMFGCG